MLNEKQKERYNRQVLLPDFGEQAQLRLSKAKVLVVGAGGLGCPVLQYIVGAGIGHVGIIDSDRVSLSNLQRQILYREDDIGLYKSELAAERMKSLNSEVVFSVYTTFLTENNAADIIKQYDIIVGATDNFESRYLIDKYTKEFNIPFVHGSIGEYEGQFTVFNYKGSKSYSDLFSGSASKSDEILGVIGALPGVIGSYMAWEVIKIASEIGEVAANKLFIYNGFNNVIHQIKY